MDRRFTALRVVGTVSKVFAWISLMLGILLAILVLVLGFTMQLPQALLGMEQGGALVGLAGFVIILLSALLLYLAFYAGGEFLYLFLSIEENTRRSAYIAQQQYLTGQAVVPMVSAPTGFSEDQPDAWPVS